MREYAHAVCIPCPPPGIRERLAIVSVICADDTHARTHTRNRRVRTTPNAHVGHGRDARFWVSVQNINCDKSLTWSVDSANTQTRIPLGVVMQ